MSKYHQSIIIENANDTLTIIIKEKEVLFQITNDIEGVPCNVESVIEGQAVIKLIETLGKETKYWPLNYLKRSK